MGKKELAEKAAFEKAVGIRGGFKAGLIAALKFIVALILLPLLIGLSRAFSQELQRQSAVVAGNFFLGVIVYLAIHLFVCELDRLNGAAQMLAGRLFSFYVPLRTIVYSCLPVYATLFFALHFAFRAPLRYAVAIGYFVFFIAFSATMHLVVSAAQLRKDSMSALKGDYFFSLAIVYLFEIVLLAGFFYFMLADFSFIAFAKDGVSFFVATLEAAWKQLFMLR